MTELIYSIMPGVGAMPNIHPMLVHFPIAFLNGFLLMEVFGFILKRDEFRIAARWMLYLGTLGALVAVAAGLRAEATLPHNEAIHEILLRHKGFGITVLVLSVVLSVWRIFRETRFKAPERMGHMLLAAVMLGILAFGADMGGLMVYKHGAGVKAVPVIEQHDHAGGGSQHGTDNSEEGNEQGKKVHTDSDGHHDTKPQKEGGEAEHHHGG
jgi:uncharacterized membrane protein